MTTKDCTIRPFLKWAGGKRRLLPEIARYAPPAGTYETYFEPFLGSGAVLFHVQPISAVVNDSNLEIVNCYQVVRDAVEDLIAELRRHRNDKEYFYEIRQWDRQPNFAQRTPIERAARLIFLNKTCFNGLHRVNAQGQFNVPFGRYRNPKIADEETLRAASAYLRSADITFMCGDFAEAMRSAHEGDFVYLDPPYDPLSETASFTGYSMQRFGRDEQQRLKLLVDDLDRRGCQVLLSNSSTDFTRKLYAGYRMVTVGVPRAINSNGKRRGKVDELLVMNFSDAN